jgi:plasmid stabilization system protein ParE
MSVRLTVRSAAVSDIEDAYYWLEQAQSGLGGRFIEQLREVFERLESMPEIHGIVWRDVRAVRLKRFRYVVYYTVFTDRVEVLAVLHGSRHESAWQSRD